MRQVLTIGLVTLAFALVPGCSLVSSVNEVAEGSLAFQWATARAIRESDDVTGQSVLDFIERARPHVESSEGSVDILVQRIQGEIDWDEMYPEDRRMLEAIFTGAVQRLRDRDLPAEDLRMEARDILDSVETAALMVSGG